MCGIVGAIADRNVTPVLLDGLQRLEYRGYDSSGLAVITSQGQLERKRSLGRVDVLSTLVNKSDISGNIGIAHTRWATHGKPAEHNAHPHVSRERVAVVHNGIIENYEDLRREQLENGYEFSSETDTEVIVHQIESHLSGGHELLAAVRATVDELVGAYALGVISNDVPGTLIAARRGSPLLVGLGEGEFFIASDMSALLPVTQSYIVLEDGDVAEVTVNGATIYDVKGDIVERTVHISSLSEDSVDLGSFQHYMAKEIHEQGRAIADTLEGRLSGDRLLEQAFGVAAGKILDRVEQVQFVACGTSFHAAMVARYWFEELGIRCDVEVASEYRYRSHVVQPGTLFVTISQSGETADTLAALNMAKELSYTDTLCICNVPESSLVRGSALSIMTHAGPEIGVASTKAFTTQLVALLMLGIALRRRNTQATDESALIHELRTLPAKVEQALQLEEEIKGVAQRFADKEHALFLGRGEYYPIAMEGALKLKEISYIHAEAYAAGELKHGPLALVDEKMPVVAVAPNNDLLEKLKSNLEAVRARGGKLIVFADPDTGLESDEDITVVNVAPVNEFIGPIIYTIPLQLLAYHVALIKGTDIDKPRNLAKSVTVE
jgi:glucosamine--fructose-6-phosphate aminotransferase (isomerizing)